MYLPTKGIKRLMKILSSLIGAGVLIPKSGYVMPIRSMIRGYTSCI